MVTDISGEMISKDKPRLKVSYGVTLNCGNFESVRADVGLERTLDEDESIDGAYREMFAIVKRRCEREARRGQKKLM